MFFLRKSRLELLPVAMSGVRMGERALQIGVDDPTLAGAIAAKVGLSGHAAIAVADEAAAAKARAGATKAGALVDLQVTPLTTLPFPADAFDAVVVHGMGGLLSSLDTATRVAVLRESHRVLRPGGRLVVIEAGPAGGLGGLFKRVPVDRAYAEAGGAVTALTTAGFRAARILAEREGYSFTEGMKAQL